MKKVLLSLVAVVMALCATAATTTITWSAQTGNFPTKWGTENTVTAEGFTFKINKNNGSTNPTYNTNGKDLRVYANGTIEITGTDDMTEINFVISTAGLKRLTNITANVGTVSGLEDCKNKKQGEIIVKWTGNAKTVTLTVGEKSTYGTDGATKAGQLDFISTEITTADSGDTREPAGLAWSESSVTLRADELDSFTAPTLTNPHNVAVTYASDNTGVATVSEAGAVTLTGTVGTAKITASFDGNTTYREQEVSCTITVEPAPTAVTTVTETIALPTGTAVKVNYPLTVAFVNHSNVFACDEDGDFIQLYGSNTLKAGDVIPAGWVGTYKLYNNTTPEIEFEALPTATEGSFTPKTVAATDITTALVNHVITIKNVDFDEATPATKTNFTGNVGETEISFRNNYSLESVEAGKYDVTVVVTIYNQAPSLYVVSYAKSETDSALLIGAGDNAAPVEYYNLQGVRIDNPANGIFIRRQGSKAQKIVL